MQNTIILFWNPEISSFTIKQYCELMAHWWNASMNWSVWEHEKAKKGDRFFLVRCGKEPNGIVMCGEFCSDPYKGEDWSGKGREVYYMDLNIEFTGGPNGHLLSSDILAKNIPNFNWYGGHSGRLIESEDDAARLEMLWQCFVEDVIHKHDEQMDEDEIDDEDEGEITDEGDDNEEDDSEKHESSEKIDPYQLMQDALMNGNSFRNCRFQHRWQYQLDEYLSKKHGTACEICGYDYRKLFGDHVENYNEYYYIGDLGCRDCDEIERNYHCVCSNCYALLDDSEDIAEAFEKYRALAKPHVQKLHLMDRFTDNVKSLQSFISEAKTSKLNQKVDHLIDGIASKSDTLMQGYEKYRAFMDSLKNKKNKS